MAPFVGRQPELAVLRARLGDALAGRPQIVQIQGPAGIGKTALLEHFLTEVRPNRRPLWSGPAVKRPKNCWPTASSSKWPARSPSPNPAEAHPVDDPVTVGTRLLEFLDQLGGSSQKSNAVILAVDDANWADRPSLQALIFALRRLAADQVLTLIAVRDDSVTSCRKASAG